MNKNKFIVYFCCFIFSLIGIIGCSQPTSNQLGNSSNAAPKSELIVSAAASLKNAMEAVKPLYLETNPNVVITYNFGSSGSLQQQIEQGAPVDIFISAATKQMDALQKKGLLLNDTRQDLLKNQMVLIVPKDNTTINSFKDLTSNASQKIALGETESVPAGKYAQEVLTSLGIFESVKPKAVYGKDVRQVLSYVATGNTDAGIVYLTDAMSSQQVKIVETAPEDSHSLVVYPIAVLKESSQVEVARELVQFLTTEQATAVFKQYGFNSASR